MIVKLTKEPWINNFSLIHSSQHSTSDHMRTQLDLMYETYRSLLVPMLGTTQKLYETNFVTAYNLQSKLCQTNGLFLHSSYLNNRPKTRLPTYFDRATSDKQPKKLRILTWSTWGCSYFIHCGLCVSMSNVSRMSLGFL